MFFLRLFLTNSETFPKFRCPAFIPEGRDRLTSYVDYAMRKLKLDLEELEVDSFRVDPETRPAARGTVKPREVIMYKDTGDHSWDPDCTFVDNCTGIETDTCNYASNLPTCQATCATCANVLSCYITCQTCPSAVDATCAYSCPVVITCAC